jgi:hypothetical protein
MCVIKREPIWLYLKPGLHDANLMREASFARHLIHLNVYTIRIYAQSNVIQGEPQFM